MPGKPKKSRQNGPGFVQSRGQVTSFDLIIAVVLFVMMFVYLRGMWGDNMGSALYDSRLFDMQMSAQQAVDSLTKTAGFPSDWVQSNVELIGLAQKPGVLDSAKVSSFVSMDYNAARTLLGLDGYEFSFDLNSANISDSNRMGPVPGAGSTAISVSRTVLYKGGEALVTLKGFER